MTSSETLRQALLRLEEETAPVAAEAADLALRYRQSWEHISAQQDRDEVALPQAFFDRGQRLDLRDRLLARAASGGLTAVALALLAAVTLRLPWLAPITGPGLLATLLVVIPLLTWALPALLGAPRASGKTAIALWLLLAPALTLAVTSGLASLSSAALAGGGFLRTPFWRETIVERTVAAATFWPALLLGVLVGGLGFWLESRLRRHHPWLVLSPGSGLSSGLAWLLLLALLAAGVTTVAGLRETAQTVFSPDVTSALSAKGWRRYPFLTRGAAAEVAGPVERRVWAYERNEGRGEPRHELESLLPHLQTLDPAQLPPELLLGLAETIDGHLGTLHRTYSHDTTLESQLLPLQLKLWAEVRRRLPKGQLWGLRTTGTLYSLQHVLEDPATTSATLTALQAPLEGLQLTAGELEAFLRSELVAMTETANLASWRRPGYAFGLLDSPLALARSASFAGHWKTLPDWSERQEAQPLTLETVAQGLGPLSQASSSGTSLWQMQEIVDTAGLPLRLAVSLQALRARTVGQSPQGAEASPPSDVPEWLKTVPMTISLPNGAQR